MSRRKICVVVTARPSYARIRTALTAIQEHPDLDLQLVVAASALLDRYGNADRVMEREGFRIDRRVYMILDGENLVTSAKSTGLGLAELATVFDDLKPDAVVTIADRFETMATAVSAAYMNIPLVHVQGGEVTGSIDEKVRHAITKLADLHLVSCENARQRVIRLGEQPDSIFVTGCPSIDLAKQAIEQPVVLSDAGAFGGVGGHVDLTKDYIVVLQHPVTTEHGRSRAHIEETLHAVAECGIPAVWFWPNVDAGSDGTSRGIRAFREHHDLPHVHFIKNLPPEDFVRLVYNSRCIVGNSSMAIREASWLGAPAVNIGNRQADRDRGRNVVDVPYDRQAILAAIRSQAAKGRLPSDPVYGNGDAGVQIADVLAKAPLRIEKRLTY